MMALAIEALPDSDKATAISVRGHRFNDWIARLGKRLSFKGLEDPPRTRRVRAEDHLSIEVSLPGFRAREVEIVCDDGWISIDAKRITVETRENSEMRVARLVLALDDDFDLPTGSAEMRNGRLVVHLPLKESAKTRRIPIRAR